RSRTAATPARPQSIPARSARPSPTTSGRPPARRRGRAMATRSSRFAAAALHGIAAWALPLALVAAWEGASPAGLLPARGLAAPRDVAVAFWQNLSNGTLIDAAAISTERALIGLVIGGLVGFVFGVVNGIWRGAETAFDSSMQMLRNVPHLAIIPLVILWFGI